MPRTVGRSGTATDLQRCRTARLLLAIGRYRNSFATEYEQFLPGDMRLPQRHRQSLRPFLIGPAEPAVAVSVRMLNPVFLPQQVQRHARFADLSDVSSARAACPAAVRVVSASTA